MQVENYIQIIAERNKNFILTMSSESVLGLSDTLQKMEDEERDRPQCVVISFDPPLGHPPFALCWDEKDVIYIPRPQMDSKSFKDVAWALRKTKHSIIIFIEKKNPDYKRKIQRWIRNFRDHEYRNVPLREHPKFILAEYTSPLHPMVFSELSRGNNDATL